MAGLNIGMAVVFEAIEPDDLLPTGLPVDDVARQAIMKGAKEAYETGGEEALERFIREKLGEHADDVLNRLNLGTKTANELAEELPIKPLGRGSTGRTVANNLTEQLAMKQAISNPTAGRVLRITMTDPRWPASEGWVKMTQNINGVEIHYVYNTITGAVDDFKFIDR